MPIGTGRIFNADVLLPLLYQRFVISSAQLLTSFTTPIILIPALPNYTIIPEKGMLYKEPGAAYTIAGVTNLVTSWTGSAANFDQTAPASFLDQTVAAQRVINAPNSGATFIGGYNTIIGAIVGLPLEFRCAGANPAAGTGSLTIQLLYRLWPNVPLAYS